MCGGNASAFVRVVTVLDATYRIRTSASGPGRVGGRIKVVIPTHGQNVCGKLIVPTRNNVNKGIVKTLVGIRRELAKERGTFDDGTRCYLNPAGRVCQHDRLPGGCVYILYLYIYVYIAV